MQNARVTNRRTASTLNGKTKVNRTWWTVEVEGRTLTVSAAVAAKVRCSTVTVLEGSTVLANLDAAPDGNTARVVAALAAAGVTVDADTLGWDGCTV